MKRAKPRRTDYLLLQILIEAIPLLSLPFLLAGRIKLAAPRDFAWVVIFSLLVVTLDQANDFWTVPLWLTDLVLAVPVVVLLIEKSWVIACLLLMQYILKIAITPQVLEQVDLRLGLLLEQGLVPIFLSLALVDTISGSISTGQIMLISGLYLTKIAFSVPYDSFSDFLWPFLSLVLIFILMARNLLTLSATISIVIVLLASLIAYPRRKDWRQFPALLLFILSILTKLP
ncbi:hypothetical protein [Lapidilactobacillus luobeiensis]|uniref:hypothetical protein n=1 Tax=Lapidilactobacillus luobeiensis TaxID=2950371 RepID=UPI0021C3FE85|nr:hypothetical protein [Lapidilactobacillus luobeiensis]